MQNKKITALLCSLLSVHSAKQPQQHISLRKLLFRLCGYRILVVGHTKWLTMLLGMEDHSGCWCIYCLLSPTEWKELACSETGQEQTIELNNHMVDLHKISEITKSKPKLKGIKAKPLWSFIPIINYCLRFCTCGWGSSMIWKSGS
jgi:hypothetical protein